MAANDNLDDEVVRVPLTRDQLRAELAEMELRMRVFLQAELDRKADRELVETLRLNVQQLQSAAILRTGPVMDEFRGMQKQVEEMITGTLNPAQERTLNAWLMAKLNEGNVKKWTTNQRWLAVAIGAIAAGSFALNIIQVLITGTP